MFSGYKMVIEDPSKLHLLSDDMIKSVLKAASNTVNIQAAITRKNAIASLPEHFILRNTWTERSIAYDRAKKEPHSFQEIESHVGARDRVPYMARQEFGGHHKPSNGGRLSIPLDTARGGRHSSLVRKTMYRSKIKVIKYNPNQKASPGSSLISAAATAYNNDKFLKYGHNIYKIDSFKKNGSNVHFDMTMIYNRDKFSTYTKRTSWLKPASAKPAEDGQNIYYSQMRKLK